MIRTSGGSCLLPADPAVQMRRESRAGGHENPKRDAAGGRKRRGKLYCGLFRRST
jgi:hypothetical protein